VCALCHEPAAIVTPLAIIIIIVIIIIIIILSTIVGYCEL